MRDFDLSTSTLLALDRLKAIRSARPAAAATRPANTRRIFLTLILAVSATVAGGAVGMFVREGSPGAAQLVVIPVDDAAAAPRSQGAE